MIRKAISERPQKFALETWCFSAAVQTVVDKSGRPKVNLSDHRAELARSLTTIFPSSSQACKKLKSERTIPFRLPPSSHPQRRAATFMLCLPPCQTFCELLQFQAQSYLACS